MIFVFCHIGMNLIVIGYTSMWDEYYIICHYYKREINPQEEGGFLREGHH